MMRYIFCYGTLKRGEHNHSLLQDCEYVADGIVDGAGLIDMGGCPGMVIGRVDEPDLARGEIYRTTEPRELLHRLDQLENEGSFYKRISVDVWVTDYLGARVGHGYECTTYVFMPQFSSDFVEGGKWNIKRQGAS